MKIRDQNKATQLFVKYCDAYKQRDLAAILKLFTHDCNLWGTAEDEYRVGLKALEAQHLRDWSQAEKGEIQIMSFVTSPVDANWAAGICKALITVEGEQYEFDHLRGTIIVKKENDDWKIFHMHASFPDYRNHLGDSFPRE